MDLLNRFLGHDAWTTHQLLLQSRVLSDAQLDQPFDLGHGSLRATFVHIIENMEVWTKLMAGEALEANNSRDLEGLLARLDAITPELADLARNVMREDKLDALWTDILDDPPTRKTYGGAIVHVITHSMHHRAQAIHMLKRLGITDVVEGDALSWEAQAGKL